MSCSILNVHKEITDKLDLAELGNEVLYTLYFILSTLVFGSEKSGGS